MTSLRKGMVCFGLIVLSLPMTALAADPPAIPGVVVERDVQYGTGGGIPLKMDIARPQNGDGPFPAVLFIHGGGWRGGDKAGFLGAVGLWATRGYVAATVQYRFAPAHKFPAQVEDVKCAIRYLRSRAKDLKIDVNHIGAIGGSAGGHLALMLGTTKDQKALEGAGGHAEFSSTIQVAGSIGGPTDFMQVFPLPMVEGMLKDFVGTTRDANPAAYKKACPITYLTKDDAPVLIIHGTADEVVPYAQATILTDACKKTGIEATLITIQNGGHGTGGNPQDWHAANLKTLEIFDKYLKPNSASAAKSQ